MINFAPVMLLNKQAGYFDGVDDGIYIPPEFKPVVLPAGLQTFQQALFPYGISPETALAITYKLLHFLHQPDMQPYVDAWDNRRTYDISTATKYDLIFPAISIVASKSAACTMVPRYRYAANSELVTVGDSGRLSWTFRSGNTTQVEMTDQRGEVSLETVVNATTVDKSLEVTLVPGRYFAYFELPSGVLSGDYKFEYTIDLDPTYDIVSVMHTVDLVLAEASVRSALFEPFPPVEASMVDLQYAYQVSPEQSIRLGSLLMAFIYQVGRRELLKEPYVSAQ